MGTISYTLPTVGNVNSTEDPLVRTALSLLQTLVNGNIEAGNIGAALKPSGGAAAGTESLRALGTSASTAVAGNDSRVTTAVRTASGATTAIVTPSQTVNFCTTGWGTYTANFGTGLSTVSAVMITPEASTGASITGFHMLGYNTTSAAVALFTTVDQNVTLHCLAYGT